MWHVTQVKVYTIVHTVTRNLKQMLIFSHIGEGSIWLNIRETELHWQKWAEPRKLKRMGTTLKQLYPDHWFRLHVCKEKIDARKSAQTDNGALQ